MELFTISEVASAVGVSLPPGRDEVSVYCPNCDRDARGRKHLCISVQNGVYNCPRCGAHGGVLDLYGLYRDCDRKTALRELIAWRNGGGTVPAAPEPTVQKMERPIAPLEQRNAAYLGLLVYAGLRDEHRENLLKRGIPESAMTCRYASTPLPGTEIELCRKIMSDGCSLDGVPGFFKLRSGDWTIVRQKSGIMIPVTDENAYVEGIQVRLDDVTERKYRWLSSSGYDFGTGAVAACHIAGCPAETMLLTEGPLKADIIYGLSGKGVIAVPGVNALSSLEELLDRLKGSVGLKEIWVCYDMDMYENPHVRHANARLLDLLKAKGIAAKNYRWDPRYKGLDDYLLAYRKKEI